MPVLHPVHTQFFKPVTNGFKTWTGLLTYVLTLQDWLVTSRNRLEVGSYKPPFIYNLGLFCNFSKKILVLSKWLS